MARLRDRVRIIVEAGQRGVSVGGFTWDVSSWDSGGSWGSVEPSWTVLDGWAIESFKSRRGRDRANRRHPAGTATLVLVYRTPAGVWSLRPTAPVALGQEVRLRVDLFGPTGSSLGVKPIYRGAVRFLDDAWTPAAPDRPGVFRLTVQLVDRLADLGAVDLPELGSAVGLDDLTGARLARILGMANIPTYYLRGPYGTALPAGVVHHQSGTFARNLLDEAQVAVESETGDLYVDREGFLAFRERLGTGSYTRENVAQATWSNETPIVTPVDSTPGPLAPTSFGTSQDRDDVRNQVSRARTGGTAYTAGGPSTDSALRYGLRTDQRFDLTCRYDADVQYAANYWLAQLATRTQRIERLSKDVDPNMSSADLVQLLDIEIGDRHDVSWTDGEETLTGRFHVQGVDHTIQGRGGMLSWSVGVNLWAYAGEGLRPLPGVWGSAVWGYDVWG